MTASVSPSLFSKVTVVKAPSSLSSFVQTRRECGVTSMLPKNAIGCAEAGCPEQLGLVQASNTKREEALKVRVITSSRSDSRSIAVRFFMGWVHPVNSSTRPS
jgi:hypothetical protein